MNKDLIYCKTVIVGAGISGISAARNLLINNYNDFLIVEALDRIGGRIHTIDTDDDNFLEIGAQYLHGQVDNPIFYFSRDNNLLNEPDNQILDVESSLSTNFWSGSKSCFASDDGKRVPLDLIERANECFDQAITEAKDVGDQLENDISMGDFLKDRFYELIKREFKNEFEKSDCDSLKKNINGIFNWRCKCECSIAGSPSIFDMSLKYYDTYKDLKGDLHLQSKKGYKSILDKLVLIKEDKESFYSRLKLKHSLEKILLCDKLKTTECKHCKYTNDSNKVVLIIKNLNDLKELNIICDNILCTMSLGYLKSHLKNIVEPSSYIPEAKMQAILRSGFGTTNKLFLVYDEPFWGEDIDSLWLLKLLDNDMTFLNKLKTPKLFQESWTDDIVDFDVLESQNTLLCWMNQNDYYELLDDETVIEGCTKLLKTYLNKQDIPRPKKIIRTKWGTNKNFLGSYSYVALGALPTDFKLMAEPITYGNKHFIMFAGEHTHECYFSTVHGAYLTGLRESNRILETKNN